MREALHHLAGIRLRQGPDLPSPGREEKQEFMDKSSISNLNWNCLVCCHAGKKVPVKPGSYSTATLETEEGSVEPRSLEPA